MKKSKVEIINEAIKECNKQIVRAKEDTDFYHLAEMEKLKRQLIKIRDGTN
ncbi:hypothetical protein HBN50_07745 [Halobacteriovorax sp. GB3]|uniref:hypothetical protein n=1 Tax=Halobacteriovorax sp. GB3 TaxID=2719615 RepID=UPI00235F3A5A|nr:hypothetical protein [Halobacteriovorax sp. GB3]MDD0852984.1 hypothetical protein [Halobacteriovorax sp. GB3]